MIEKAFCKASDQSEEEEPMQVDEEPQKAEPISEKATLLAELLKFIEKEVSNLSEQNDEILT